MPLCLALGLSFKSNVCQQYPQYPTISTESSAFCLIEKFAFILERGLALETWSRFGPNCSRCYLFNKIQSSYFSNHHIFAVMVFLQSWCFYNRDFLQSWYFAAYNINSYQVCFLCKLPFCEDSNVRGILVHLLQLRADVIRN